MRCTFSELKIVRYRIRMPQRHLATCTLCEAICGIVVETEGRRVVSIRGDRDDPFSRGHICPKAVGLQDVHDDPDRLTRPMRRHGSSWQEIGWEEAFDEVASRLTATQRAHGRDAVAVYLGNPTVHSLGAMLYTSPFVRALQTKNRFSATSVDQLPHHLVACLMFGHQLLLPIPDIDRTMFLLVLGANPAVSNGSLMTAPDVARRIKDIRTRGGRVVVVDPRRTETAAIADRHHFIRPGTDALLLLALLHTVFAERLERLGRLQDDCDGLAEVRAVAGGFPPERVAAACGIDADVIRELARAFAAASRAVCYGRLGVSTQAFGALACWLVNVLNVVTGRLDEPGGAMFTRPVVDLVGTRGLAGRGHAGRWKSRVRGLPEFSGELPAAVLAEEIDTPGEGRVRALVTSAGNPVLSTPNGGRLERALPGLDFMVSIDFYVNETTRHAHVILPPASPLERDHYDLVFHVLAIRNTAKFSRAVFARGPGHRHEWEILSALTRRLLATRGWAQARARVEAALWQALGPRRLLDLAIRRGPYGAGFAPFARGLTRRRIEAQPHGVDLGPLESCLPARLATRRRRVQLAPEEPIRDVARLERILDGRSGVGADTLSLIGRRDLRSNNSWMHNSARLVKGPRRCTLRMHPDDVAARGLGGAARVRVRSRVGAIEADLEVTDEVMPGVVSLPHGWGHTREGTRLAVARAHPGASINDLTDEDRLDSVSGNAAFNGLPVAVEPA
jgi:anaerobic selenocysteine-containing dehydrogenase